MTRSRTNDESAAFGGRRAGQQVVAMTTGTILFFVSTTITVLVAIAGGIWLETRMSAPQEQPVPPRYRLPETTAAHHRSEPLAPVDQASQPGRNRPAEMDSGQARPGSEPVPTAVEGMARMTENGEDQADNDQDNPERDQDRQLRY